MLGDSQVYYSHTWRYSGSPVLPGNSQVVHFYSEIVQLYLEIVR